MLNHSKKKTYEFDLTCGNCQEENTLEIPFGITWEEHTKNLPCENCGCRVYDTSNEVEVRE